MSILNNINFKDYIYDYDDLKDNNNLKDLENLKYKKIKLLSKKELNKKLEKKKILNKFNRRYVKNVIFILNTIGDTIKKMCHTMEYYLIYLTNSKNNNNKLLDESPLSLFNLLNLDLLKDEYLTNNKGEYISIEKYNIFFIPIIEIVLDKNSVNINIRDEYNLNTYKLNHVEDIYIAQSNIENLIYESNDIVLYFRKKYSLIASIINQLKINNFKID